MSSVPGIDQLAAEIPAGTPLEQLSAARALGGQLRARGDELLTADDGTDYGTKCRIYRTPEGPTGIPADRWIVAALTTP
jgi:hypothetical protein